MTASTAFSSILSPSAHHSRIVRITERIYEDLDNGMRKLSLNLSDYLFSAL
ncbi:MAG: hypothetical protein WAK26_17590 [Terracidiphilus sp.]